MVNILTRRQTKRFITGSTAALFLLLQLPLFLFATPNVSATHTPDSGDKTNKAEHYENDETGKCVKYDRDQDDRFYSEDGKTFTVPIDLTKDYTYAVVKAANEKALPPNINENTFYNDVEGGMPLTHESKKEISHVILCAKDLVEQPETGTVTIVKETSVATDEKFNFTSTLTGTANASFELGSDEEKVVTELALDQTYTVTEAMFDGWTLTELECSVGGTGDETTRTATVMLTEENQDVTCTFTNTKDMIDEPETGTVTIVKETSVATDEKFNFTSTLTGTANASFELGSDEEKVVTELALDQTYTVTEAMFDGWTLTELECSVGGTGDETTRTATVMLTEENQDVTCTFTNTKDDVDEPVVTDNDVTLCHSTASQQNPFVKITVSAAGAANGHYGTAPGEEETKGEHRDGKDIIPTFTYRNMVYPPQGNQALLAFEDCVLPVGGGDGIDRNPVVSANTNVKTTPVLSLFTPQVLGASTATPTDNKQLVNTGSTMLLNLFAGLFLIGMVGALAAGQRRQYS